jgi:hypothetical protein
MGRIWCNLHSDSTETEWICSVRQVIISVIVICYDSDCLLGSGMGIVCNRTAVAVALLHIMYLLSTCTCTAAF